MPRTLVTGGAGFIGLHLARTLAARGHELTLIDNFARGVADRELEEMRSRPRAALVARDLLAGPLDDLGGSYDYVVHLAALIGVRTVRERPYDVLSHNYRMLERVIGFARRQPNLRRLAFASTSEVYAGTLQYFGMAIPTPESTPLALTNPAEPRTSYMLSKIHGEAVCRFSGLPVSIFRVHNAYGPRMGLSHVVPELLQKAHRLAPGGRLPVFSPAHRRTFCFASDIAEMIGRILETPGCEGETLNIGSQAPEYTMEEVGRLALQVTGRADAAIERMPETPGSPARRAPDMSKTAALIGYQARVSLPEGMRQTYEWYKANVFEGAGVSAL
jgi:nucleoside-diphosphate-sugar epimerase